MYFLGCILDLEDSGTESVLGRYLTESGHARTDLLQFKFHESLCILLVQTG